MQTIEKTKVDLLIESLENNDFISDPELTPQMVEILRYFINIESLTPITYAPLARWLPLYLDPDLRKFVDKWDREEAKHGQVLRLYLEKHNYRIVTPPEETLGFWYWLEVVGIVALSWPLEFIATGIYLVVGAVNEATTSAGYWALMQKSKQHPLLLEIIKAIQKEEADHLRTYSDEAPNYLPTRVQQFLAKMISPMFLNPIGSKHGDVAELVRHLLADGADAGFYSRFKRNLNDVDKVVSNVKDRMVGLIQKIQYS